MFTEVPTRKVGPVKVLGRDFEGEVMIPLATYETPLWASTQRGSKATNICGGISTSIVNDFMTRSVILEASNSEQLITIMNELSSVKKEELKEVIESTGRFVKLMNLHFQIISNLLYIRFEMTTGDASGHNMTTKAADAALKWILSNYKNTKYVSISGNYCTDKKVSSVNGILGRGKSVIAEVSLSKEVCETVLKTTPQKLVDINLKKNLIGSIIAGSVRSANAHYANALLAFYIATGQDGANVVEGSQGITYASLTENGVYFSVNLPNIIIGTIGNGKNSGIINEMLNSFSFNSNTPGSGPRILAAIAASSVLCSELSLLAAQTNQGELVNAHMRLERNVNRH